MVPTKGIMKVIVQSVRAINTNITRNVWNEIGYDPSSLLVRKYCSEDWGLKRHAEGSYISTHSDVN